MERKFCPKCGNNTLLRFSASTDENGNVSYTQAQRLTTRGTIYSIPLPKGGRNSKDLILTEDQYLFKTRYRSLLPSLSLLLPPSSPLSLPPFPPSSPSYLPLSLPSSPSFLFCVPRTIYSIPPPDATRRISFLKKKKKNHYDNKKQ